jgi:hypothetical protein
MPRILVYGSNNGCGQRKSSKTAEAHIKNGGGMVQRYRRLESCFSFPCSPCNKKLRGPPTITLWIDEDLAGNTAIKEIEAAKFLSKGEWGEAPLC